MADVIDVLLILGHTHRYICSHCSEKQAHERAMITCYILAIHTSVFVMLGLNKFSEMSNRHAEKNMTKQISFVSLSVFRPAFLNATDTSHSSDEH